MDAVWIRVHVHLGQLRPAQRDQQGAVLSPVQPDCSWAPAAVWAGLCDDEPYHPLPCVQWCRGRTAKSPLSPSGAPSVPGTA
ncbi:unnamed protein product [Gadus morhua 'NCC']